jgi:hypothetical protein
MLAKISLMVLALALSFAGAAEKTPAQKSGELVRHVKMGTTITVVGFNEKLNAFSITINSETAVGPNYAEPEELRRAIGLDGDAQSMMRNKSQMAGSEYQLKKPLLLLTENEVIKREAKHK